MATPTASNEIAPHPDAELAAMGFVDVDQNPNIGIFVNMVEKISRVDTPQAVMAAFADAMRAAHGDSALITVTCRGLKPGQYKITRRIGYDNVNAVEVVDVWNNRDQLPTVSGGFIGQLIATPTPKYCRSLDVPDDPVLGDWFAEYGSMIAIPAFLDGTATNWALIFRRESDGYTLTELEEQILRANLIGATVNNVVVNQQLRHLNAQMQREVHRIADIQRALLPKRLPKITGLDIGASYQTYDTAGGDMYDFVCLLGPGNRGKVDPNARWGFVIGDASGHGPSAAVVMAMLNAILYAYPKVPEGPAELLRYANAHLCAKRIEESFVTAFMAIYDPPTRRLTFARAGHPPALVKAAGKPMRRLDEGGGLPLGIMEDAEYEDTTITLEVGQTLVLYTDGITESMNAKEDMFGIDGIEQSLVECAGDPDCVIGSITMALREHEGSERPNDDQTIVAMQVVDRR